MQTESKKPEVWEEPVTYLGEVVEGGPGSGRQGLIERLLSPQSLQRMMLCGGGVLVLGVVVWLWSVGVFQNPRLVAVLLGIGNATMLGAGVAMIRSGRYPLSGRAITLLGSLFMPLHLWFYDAQGLITLDQGGHLWIPAVVCCVLYAALARLLRDSAFVYTLVGGIVLTGFLFLADESVGRFYTILPTATFLVGLGAICIHSERLFSEPEGAFSRGQFGRAFFLAGQGVLLAGVAILASGYVAAGLYDHFLSGSVWFERPGLADDQGAKFWGSGLCLLVAYVYGYAHLTRPVWRIYLLLSLAFLICGALTFINALSIAITISLVSCVIAVSLIVLNGLSKLRHRPISNVSSAVPAIPLWVSLVVVWGLATTGTMQYLFWLFQGEGFAEPLSYNVLDLMALGLTAVAGWTSPLFNRSRRWGAMETALVSLGTLVTIPAACMILSGLQVPVVGWGMFALLSIPVSMIVSGHLLPATTVGKSLRDVGLVTMLGLLVVIVWNCIAMGTGSLVVSWMWAGFFLLCSLIFLIAGWPEVRSQHLVFSILCGTLSATQYLLLASLPMEYSLIIATLSVGVVLLLVQGVMHRLVGGGHETTVSLAGNIAVLIGVTGGILLSLQRLVESQVTSELVVMLLSQFVPLALAFGMSVDRSWRTAFKIAATVTGVCLLMVFSQYSNLLLIQKVEVMSLLVGGLLTGVGYWGWSQERDDRRESVSIQLQLGSLFLAAPITMGLLASRLLEFGTPSWQMFHEWGALAVGLMLLGSGVVCQIRSTTLAGSGVLAAFIISLLTWVRWPEQLQSASVMLMIGGGAFFGVALLMSLYRERLISLPQRIRSGEGVYRVFKWR